MRFFIAILLISSAALAGNREKTGNGGLGVVCRDESGVLISVETLDLFETKNRYGLELIEESRSAYFQARNKLAELTPEFFNLFVKHEIQLPRMSVVGERFELTETFDSGTPMPVMQKGCTIEQIAVYTLENDALIAKDELLSKMDDLNRAALKMHEVIYLMDRKLNAAESSMRTRKIVAHLFAKDDSAADDTLVAEIRQAFPSK